MIKNFLLILTILFINLKVLAADTNYAKLCPVNPYKSQITPSKVTGMNWLTEKIAQGIIKHELKKETKGKFKVVIKSRSTTDLLNGKFNYLSMTGKNLNLDGSHISKFTSTTVCDFNSVKLVYSNTARS